MLSNGNKFHSMGTISFVKSNGGDCSLTTATISSLSTRSSGVCCRICQDSTVAEALIKPCDCMGTIAFVHSSCLEKWLSQSARKECELCKFEFKTVMKSKRFTQWLCGEDLSRNQRRYMFADSSCFMLLTPLGLVSCWLCVQGAQQYYGNDDFWTGFSLIVLSGFLTVLYVFWFAITLRFHYQTFRNWQRRNTEVRLVFSDHIACSLSTTNEKATSSNQSTTAVGVKVDKTSLDEIVIDCQSSDYSNGEEETRLK